MENLEEKNSSILEQQKKKSGDRDKRETMRAATKMRRLSMGKGNSSLARRLKFHNFFIMFILLSERERMALVACSSSKCE